MKKRTMTIIISNLAILAMLTGCGKNTEQSEPIITPEPTNENVVGSAASESELLQMLHNNQEIEIEVAVPVSIEQGEEITIQWTQLDQLTSQPEMRKAIDDIFKIINVDATKNGVLYVNLKGEQDGNNTLFNVFANNTFRNNYWNNESIREDIATAVANNYVDLEFETNNYDRAVYAGINAYFNLLNDAEPGYANLDSTITRLESMSAIFKAEFPVTDTLSIDQEFNDAVGADSSNEFAIFASNLSEQSYLTTSTGSLNPSTAKGVITRGELAYILVQRYFAEEYNKADITKTPYSDVKNGGDIATIQKFTTADTQHKGWQSYELVYALQNPDGGCPERMYKALVVAKELGIITDSECRWEEAATKADFLEMLTNTYLALPTKLSAERGTIAGYEAPADEQQPETPNFEDLDDEDKANVNRNDSDSVDGLPEVKDPEDTPDTPVEDEPVDEPTTPSNQRNNTIPEEDIPFYLAKIGISRAEFDKLTNKQAEDMLYRALVNEATGGGTPSGSTGGDTPGGNSSPEIGNGGDNDLPIAPTDTGGAPAGSM